MPCRALAVSSQGAMRVYCHLVKIYKTATLDESSLQPDLLPSPAWQQKNASWVIN